jgi:glycine/D-amino acid oxidase-like deaminating enzyme
MHTEVLIVGQGICGTLLSWFLEQNGFPHLVADDGNPNATSKMAAGIINPVSGRMREKAWMIEEVMKHAVELYAEMGAQLDATLVSQKDLLDFFPSPQMRLSFTEQAGGHHHPYLQWPVDDHRYDDLIHHSFGYGIIRPCYTVNMKLLLALWRKRLAATGRLIEKKINIFLPDIKKSLVAAYGITAGKIIFCDGAAASVGHLFSALPFSCNKGESLLVNIPGFPQQHIFKRTFSLSPAGNGYFHWGASHQWNSEDAQPSEAFRLQAETQLRQFIKLPFTVEGHFAALRPATVERRPFAGFHPKYPAMGILNGMGSKGASLAPWFARQMAGLICGNMPVQPEADINRFKKMLLR